MGEVRNHARSVLGFKDEGAGYPASSKSNPRGLGTGPGGTKRGLAGPERPRGTDRLTGRLRWLRQLSGQRVSEALATKDGHRCTLA